MKDWQFNVLFFVGVGGAVLLLIGPDLGLKFADNPATYTGVGAILTYVLAQARSQIHHNGDSRHKRDRRSKEVDDDGLE